MPTSSVNALVLLGFLVQTMAQPAPVAKPGSPMGSRFRKHMQYMRGDSEAGKKEELPDITELSGKTRPLEGQRLEAFCYLKATFNKLYKVRSVPMPSDKVNADGKRKMYWDQMEKHTKTCAMVSSSGALLAHNFGKDIDAHEAVFRFNQAPTTNNSDNWEDKVGSRTDFRLGHDFPPGCGMKVCHTFPWGYTWNGPAQGRHIRHIFPNAPEPLLNQTTHLSTGFHGMLWGLASCGSLDAYEMTPSKVASKYKYHYWETGNGGGKDSGSNAAKNNWHGYADEEHYLWRMVSTTPEEEILATGKAHYPSFDSVACPQKYMLDRPPIVTTYKRELGY